MRRTPLRILIADDHRLMLAAIRRVLDGQADLEVVGEAKAGDEVVPLALATRPDVVLLDVGMPKLDGIECARQLRRLLPRLRIVMLTAYGDAASIAEAERAGADGYVLKSVAAVDLAEAIRTVGRSEGLLLAGFPDGDDQAAELTEREQAVLQAASEGLSNRQIGRQLWITDQTVRFHLKNVRGKLGASDRAETIKLARERGLVGRLERTAARA